MNKNKLDKSVLVVYVITGFVSVSYLLHLILLWCNPHRGGQLNIFYASLEDFFADFFNVLRYVAGRDVYFNEIGGYQESPYLPLCYMLIYPFSCLNNYTTMSLSDCWHSQISMMSAFMYTLFSIFVFVHALVLLMKKHNVNKLLLIPILISNIFLFSIERGNWILLAAAGIFYFLALFDSKNLPARYFGLFMLVFASVLKVYPVFFGLFLLKEKRYKDIGYCVVMGVLLTILPFFFFKHGLGNIPQLFINLKLNSEVYKYSLNPKFGLAYMVYPFSHKLLKLNDELSNFMFVLSEIVVRLCCIIALFLSYKTKDRFLATALLIFSILFFPAHSEYYCGLYLMPLIIMTPNLFLENRKERMFFVIYSILILQCVQIVYLPIMYNFTRILVNFFTLLIFVYVLVITVLKIKADKEVK